MSSVCSSHLPNGQQGERDSCIRRIIMPSCDITGFDKFTLTGVEYKPLLAAFATIDFCLLLATDGFSKSFVINC